MVAEFSNQIRPAVAMVIAVVGIAACPLLAPASTVVPMNSATMADHAGQVIVGRVAAIRSYWLDDPRRIESEITFEQVEYLKGRLHDSTPTFVLRVPGGTVGDTHMYVCCSPDFAVGDKWVLFLLPSYNTYPVVGLYQGSFLVEADAAGIERVYSCRHQTKQPIAGFDGDGFVEVRGEKAWMRSTIHDRLRETTNARVRSDAPDASPREAMTLDAFLSEIRPVLAASRSHDLTRAAGQPDTVHRTARPLVPAGKMADRPADDKATLRGQAPVAPSFTPRRPARSAEENR